MGSERWAQAVAQGVISRTVSAPVNGPARLNHQRCWATTGLTRGACLPFLQVAVQTLPSGVRGIVATSNLAEGHVVVDLPASCTAFSAEVGP